jgi:adenylate cyclase
MGNSTRSASVKKTVPAILAVVLTAAFASVAIERIDLTDPNFLTDLEVRWQDARFRARGARFVGSEVVIVGLEETTVAKLGSARAFQRRYFATLVSKLAEAGAKVIGFGLTFQDADLSDPDNDLKFANAIEAADRVVLGVTLYSNSVGARHNEQKLDDDTQNLLTDKQILPVPHYEPGGVAQTQKVSLGNEIEPNLDELTKSAASFGFANFHRDSQGRVRYQPQVIDYRGRLYPSLDLQLLRRFLDAPSVLVSHDENGYIRGIRIGDHTIPTDASGRVLVDFSGPRGTYPMISMIDVIEGRIAKETFKDKIVLIGAPALGFDDVVTTPFGAAIPSIELHANVLDSALHSHYIYRGRLAKTIDVTIILAFGLVASLYLTRLNAGRSLFYTSLMLAGFAAFNYWAFLRLHWVLGFVYPGLSMLVTGGFVISYKYVMDEREKKRTRQQFKDYLDPQAIEQVIDQVDTLKLAGEKRDLTVLFSDIRGFTNFSEKMAPAEVVHFLNHYFDRMTALIFKTKGTLDKMIGDDMMCFWGHPIESKDHALRAVVTALEMTQAVEDLRGVLVLPGGAQFEIVIGINTGPMLVGNMGSKRRFSYTVMGENVNVGSWLESLNKHYGTKIIISDKTFQDVKESVLCRQLDTIQVKGKNQTVTIYEPLGVRPVDADRRKTDRRGELTLKKKVVKSIVTFVHGERRREDRRLGSDRVLVRPEQEEVVTMYEHGLSLYRKGDFDGAVMVFDHVLSISPGDGPSRLMKSRIAKYRAEQASAQFDPVFKFDV